MQVAGPNIPKCGVIIKGEAPGAVAGLVEKPNFEEVPSDMASFGRCILTPDIFDVLRDLLEGSGREIQLADAVNIQAQRGKVNSLHSAALCFDCGSEDEFLATISHVSNLRHS
jgi:UTP--glucose-1-phosphate uridylyltransferase